LGLEGVEARGDGFACVIVHNNHHDL